jgi:glucosylceramidase
LSGVESTNDLSNLLSPIKKLMYKSTSTLAVDITVDTSLRFQSILGFGGAFTEAAANNFASLSASDQEEVLSAYYASPEDGGNGYKVGRVHMNSCDFSVTSYSFDDAAGDTSMSQFDMNVTHDQRTMLPFMRRAVAKAPGGVNIFASPWSPPAWMKTNGRMTGSGDPGLRSEDQAAWALYFSKFFTAYRANGVNLWGLTVQNEPGYAAPWEACKYSAAQERDFVKNHLGPIMRRDHPDAKIMVLDHNRDMVPEWTSTIFGDAEAAKYVDGLALHWYDSKNAQMYANVEAAHDQYLSKLPGRFILGTEACNCPGVKLRDWDRAWSIASDILGDLNAWAVGWTDWNLIVDHQGGPNHLGNFCDANIIADPGNVLGAGTVIKQVSYYLMGHFSRYLRPGMVRVKSDATAGVSVTAFQDPETKRTAVVVMNGQNSAVEFNLNDKVSGRSATGLAIPAHSIQTYVYTAEPNFRAQVVV